MLYALWSLLNLAAFVYVIMLCFKATKIIRDKYGVSASILVTLIVLSLLSQSNRNDEYRNSQAGTNRFVLTPKDSIIQIESVFKTVTMEKNWVSNYELSFYYSTDIHGKPFVPVEAYTTTSGLISGVYWRPESIVINRLSDDGQFGYIVSGVKYWTLLGTTLYIQPVDFRGKVKAP